MSTTTEGWDEWIGMTPEERINKLAERVRLLETRVEALTERKKLDEETDGSELA